VVCAGFEGLQLDAPLQERLAQTPLAGLIFFGRNVENVQQAHELTAQIRQVYANPIVAIDQEGGRVARLREGVEELPSMMALAATGDLSLAQRAGEQIAFDLRRAGVNVDFAPVLDLALFADNTVIGARSFGDDPRSVTSFAQAFATGMRAQGIVPTFKHFPGHGSTERDSHLELPVIEEDERVLRSRDFVPFQQLLPSSEAVMTAHVVVNALDPERPATVSRRILTGLLREEMGFAGVCFTDCMEMDAIAKGIGSAAAAVQALAAGADCILVSRTFTIVQDSISGIVDAVQSGVLPESRLYEAYERVSALRKRLQPPLAVDDVPPHRGIGLEIGRRAVTVVRGTARAQAGDSIVVSFEGATNEGVQGLHTEHSALPAPTPLPLVQAALDPDPGCVHAAIERVRSSGKRPIVLMRRAHVYRKQWDAVQSLLDHFPDALIVSVREPFDALALDRAEHVLCTYGDDAPSLAGLCEVIFGSAEPLGHLPVHDIREVAGR
jgi:beta-N-acetylhexosaminidase